MSGNTSLVDRLGATMSPSRRRGLRPVRTMLAASFLIMLVVFCASISFGVGSTTLTPAGVARGLWRTEDASPIEMIAAHARTTRAIMAVLVGGGLGVSGALLQALYRNPLAGPSITGVSQGAITAVIGWVTFGPAVDPEAGTLTMALVGIIGGSLAGLATFGLSRLGGRADPMRLILMGVLLGGVLSGVISLALLQSGEGATDIIRWVSGSLGSTGWDEVRIVAGGLVLFAPLVIVCIPLGNALALGDDVAHGVGQSVTRARLCMLLVAGAITAVSVSLVGGLAFVGLVAPHLARPHVGSDLRRLVPAAAIVGAGLVLLADGFSRNVRPAEFLPFAVSPNTLPAGLFLAVFGGLFFVRAIRRTT